MSYFIFLVVQHHYASSHDGNCQHELPYNLDYGKLRTADEGGGDGGKQRSMRAALCTCSVFPARARFRVRGSANCNCALFCRVFACFCDFFYLLRRNLCFAADFKLVYHSILNLSDLEQ